MKTFSCIFPLFLYLISADIEQINQIINGNFANPGVPSYSLNKLNIGSMEGWTCTHYCQVQNCTKLWQYYPKVNNRSLECSNFVVDLNSLEVNQEMTQQLNLTLQYYWLQFDYIYPQYNAKFKELQVIFNEQNILSVKPNVSYSIELNHFKMRVQGKDGINKLIFRQIGYQFDGTGFKVANISLNRQYNSALESTMSYFFDLQFLNKGSSIPGGRIYFRNVLSFMVNFDRLQFYSYHNRQYSQNVRKFLSQIRLLQSIKGNLIQESTRKWFPSIIKKIDQFFAHSEKKMKYINYHIIDKDKDKNSEKNQTFSNYIKYYLTFSLPIIITIFLILHILFNLIKDWAISIIIRPYAFYETLIFILLQGNIQQIAFHGFGDLTYLFSLSFKHKLVNLLSLLILFFVVFICFGLYFLLKVSYSKKVKVITDSKDDTLLALLSINFDKEMIIFLLGTAHQILLNTPQIQMIVLIAIEVTWLIKGIAARSYFSSKLLILVWILQSLLRIYFQITSLVFSNCSNYRITINQQYHSILIFAFIIIICIDVTINIYFMLKHFFTSRIFRKNTVNQSALNKIEININQKRSVKDENSFEAKQNDKVNNHFEFISKIVSHNSKNNLQEMKTMGKEVNHQSYGINKTLQTRTNIKQRLKEMKMKITQKSDMIHNLQFL